MRIKMSLLKMMTRQCLPATLIGLPIACFYVLVTRGPLDWTNPWMGLFILAHSTAVAFCLGRYRSPGLAFLYTRGYSRDELWTNKILATVLAVLAVWLPVALIVWLPVRSRVQDVLFRSPYFPIMMMREVSVPWAWLAGYAFLPPLFHYVWIRRAQPLAGGDGVVLLAIGTVIAVGIFMLFGWLPRWFWTVLWILAAAITVTNLVAGFLLHRKIEVE
jgi:hypothetical protein